MKIDLDKSPLIWYNNSMNKAITEKIDTLISTLQALTIQRVNALRLGKQEEASQIQAVQIDIDNKIQELERSMS